MEAYCIEKGYNIDHQRFYDFYASKGWKVGSQPMKDWQAAVRNWVRGEQDRAAPKQVPQRPAQQPTGHYNPFLEYARQLEGASMNESG